MAVNLGLIASSLSAHLDSGAYESIATATPSGSSTFTFSSIPDTYKHLQVRYSARTTRPITFGSYIYYRLNGDAGTSYYNRHRIDGRGDGLIYAEGAGSATFASLGLIAGNNGVANTVAAGIMDLYDYSSTTKSKTSKSSSVNLGQTTSTDDDIILISSLWFPSSSAVNSMTIFLDSYEFAAGSHFALYGIRG